MDGNGRWAKEHHLPRIGGHRRGAITVRNITTVCTELGIDVLTLYAFSEENWSRPALEVSTLMTILKRFLVSERKLLQKHNVRLRAIGRLERLPEGVRKTLNETLRLTEKNSGMNLVLALSYGGRDEITRAVQKIASHVANKSLRPEEISAETLSSYLDTADFRDPDLLIRTSGEFRTSNFLPWQSVYTEFYITDTPWPDFDRDELCKAILDYNRRERRFGKISEQIVPKPASEVWKREQSAR